MSASSEVDIDWVFVMHRYNKKLFLRKTFLPFQSAKSCFVEFSRIILFSHNTFYLAKQRELVETQEE